jgi:hypothetical protein
MSKISVQLNGAGMWSVYGRGNDLERSSRGLFKKYIVTCNSDCRRGLDW